MNFLNCAPAVAADLAAMKEHPTLGPLQGIHFNADGSALVMFRHGCLLFGPDGQPAKYQEPKGRH